MVRYSFHPTLYSEQLLTAQERAPPCKILNCTKVLLNSPPRYNVENCSSSHLQHGLSVKCYCIDVDCEQSLFCSKIRRETRKEELETTSACQRNMRSRENLVSITMSILPKPYEVFLAEKLSLTL